MNTEKLSKNLGIIAAGLLIVNLALDLYDRFSSRKNEKDGQESKNEDAQSDENSNNDEGTQDKREEDNND